jgi:hypothetical protein
LNKDEVGFTSEGEIRFPKHFSAAAGNKGGLR